MPGRASRRYISPPRRLTPLLESLDSRILLSWGGVGPRLGSFLNPGTTRQPAVTLARGFRPALSVDPHRTVNHFLGNRLGPGVDRIERLVEIQDTESDNRVADLVLSQG